MKSICRRGHVCTIMAYAPWAHTGSHHVVSTFIGGAAKIVRVALWANLCSQLFYQEIIMIERLKCQCYTTGEG